MPTRPPKPCTKPGCKAYAVKDGRCDAHPRPAWVNRPAHAGHASGWEWSRIRKQVLDRDNHLCQACLNGGRVTKATEVDHLVPRALGGDSSLPNLRALCTPCHKAKSALERARGRLKSRIEAP